MKPPTMKPPTARGDAWDAPLAGSSELAAPMYQSVPPPQAAMPPPPPPQGLLARLMSTRVQSGMFWVIIGLSLLLLGLLVILLAVVVYLRLM